MGTKQAHATDAREEGDSEWAAVIPVLSVQYSLMANTHLAASGWHDRAQLTQRQGLSKNLVFLQD